MNELSMLITDNELAKLLRLNRDTAYKAVAERQVPGVRRIGRFIRIHRQSLMAWIEGTDASGQNLEDVFNPYIGIESVTP